MSTAQVQKLIHDEVALAYDTQAIVCVTDRLSFRRATFGTHPTQFDRSCLVYSQRLAVNSVLFARGNFNGGWMRPLGERGIVCTG